MGNSTSFTAENKQKLHENDIKILEMKLQRDKLKKFQKKLEFLMGKEVEICQNCMKNKEEKAKMILFLRRIRLKREKIMKLEEQMMNLDDLAS